MIVNAWPHEFRQLYGGDWPSTYVCFDLETSGRDMEKDVITEIAHCLVEDGKITDAYSTLLNWTMHPIVADHWLRPRLMALKRGMEDAGNPCHVTYQRLREEGKDPAEVLGFYRDLFAAFRKNGVIFVAHNGYGFDEKMLHANFAGFGIDPEGFGFDDNDMLDTDGIEKASQCPLNPRMIPRAGDTLRSYFHRVRYTRVSGVKSNLSGHCFQKYRFTEKHGIRPEDMHGAAMDARCVHLLMEEYRDQIDRDAAPTADRAPFRLETAPAQVPPRRRVRGQLNR